jgi:subtilisin family serine protease
LRILQEQDLTTQQIITYGLELLAVPQVWSQTRGSGVKVCIMDTGLDLPHPDLFPGRMTGSDSKDVVRPWTQDAAGHGTHVAGTIGASNNGVGIVGVAPDADLLIVRVFNYNGLFRGSDVIAAAEQCRIGGATVINMSLGGTTPVPNEDKLFQRYFEQEGIVSVAAAGNSGQDGNEVIYPAGYASVLSVAAVDQQGQVAYFSTRNDMVNVAAPGVAVQSTYKDGRYAKLSGTSMASPHVAGVVALLQSVKPQATPLEIWELLTGTASLSSEGKSRTPELGHGLVNVSAAMNVWFPPEEVVVDTNPPTSIATNPPTNPTTPLCGAGERSFGISITTDRYGYVYRIFSLFAYHVLFGSSLSHICGFLFVLFLSFSL